MDKRFLLSAALCAALACSGPAVPSHPFPTPTPTAAGPVAPPPPLEIDNGRIVNSLNKQPVFLLGSIICCGDGVKERGWPLVTKAALDEMAAAGANFTHIRTGPHKASLEGVEFVAFNPDGSYRQEFFDLLHDIVVYAGQKQIYIEVDLVDGWGLKTDNAAWPDHARCEMLEQEPDQMREAWIRKLVQTVGAEPNVLWQDGNEIGVNPCGRHLSFEWVSGVERIVRSEETRLGFVKHLFGTNSEFPDIENAPFVDYIEKHRPTLPLPTSKPIMVNEYAGVSPTEWERLAKQGKVAGVSFHQWRDEWTEGEIQQALASLRAVVDYKP